jgi:hypothetical protein
MAKDKRKKKSKYLLDCIMNIVRNTPTIDHAYMCHGEYHTYDSQDYKTMRSKISKLLETKAIGKG